MVTRRKRQQATFLNECKRTRRPCPRPTALSAPRILEATLRKGTPKKLRKLRKQENAPETFASIEKVRNRWFRGHKNFKLRAFLYPSRTPKREDQRQFFRASLHLHSVSPGPSWFLLEINSCGEYKVSSSESTSNDRLVSVSNRSKYLPELCTALIVRPQTKEYSRLLGLCCPPVDAQKNAP